MGNVQSSFPRRFGGVSSANVQKECLHHCFEPFARPTDAQGKRTPPRKRCGNLKPALRMQPPLVILTNPSPLINSFPTRLRISTVPSKPSILVAKPGLLALRADLTASHGLPNPPARNLRYKRPSCLSTFGANQLAQWAANRAVTVPANTSIM